MDLLPETDILIFDKCEFCFKNTHAVNWIFCLIKQTVLGLTVWTKDQLWSDRPHIGNRLVRVFIHRLLIAQIINWCSWVASMAGLVIWASKWHLAKISLTSSGCFLSFSFCISLLISLSFSQRELTNRFRFFSWKLLLFLLFRRCAHALFVSLVAQTLKIRVAFCKCWWNLNLFCTSNFLR